VADEFHEDLVPDVGCEYDQVVEINLSEVGLLALVPDLCLEGTPMLICMIVMGDWGAAVAQEVIAVVWQQEGCWFDPRATCWLLPCMVGTAVGV